MRAHDDVNVVARIARFFEIVEKGQLEIAPHGIAAHLVIADAGIDHYALALGFEYQRVDRHPELAFLVSEGRKQPACLFLDVLWCRVGQQPGARPWGFAFNDAADLDVSYIPGAHWGRPPLPGPQLNSIP